MGLSEIGSYLLLRLLRLVLDAVAWLVGLRHASKVNYIPPVRDPILLLPATLLADKIRSGKLRSAEVVAAVVDRILEVNPLINAVVDSRFEAALAEARALDVQIQEDLASGLVRSPSRSPLLSLPFLGVPFTVKNSIAIEGLDFSVGLWRRRGYKAPHEAEVVTRLKAAGAIPLAITNTPELCMWWDGFNRIFGRTVNPFDASRIVGGSSSGEVALTAAAAIPLSIGSDLAGSIRNPCHFLGLYGHKPSPFLVPTTGMYPNLNAERQYLLAFGPISRYARDLLPVLKTLAGPEASAKARLDEKVDLARVNIYYMLDDGGDPMTTKVDPAIRAAILRAAAYARNNLGCPVVKEVSIRHFRDTLNILLADLKRAPGPGIRDFLTDPAPGEKEGTPRETLNIPLEMFKCLAGLSQYTFNTLTAAFLETLTPARHHPKSQFYAARLQDLKRELEELIGNGRGLFLYPTHPEAAPKHSTTPLKIHNCGYTSIVNSLEMCATQIPAGLDESARLPVGFQVLAAAGEDRIPLAFAEAMEPVFSGWIPPCRLQISPDVF